MTTSLGVIETRGLISAIHAADAACKSAAVTLVGCKKIGSGLVSVMFHGEISAVSAAVENGVDAAQQVEASLVIARPDTSVLAMLENEPSSTPKPPEEGCSEHSSEPAAKAESKAESKAEPEPSAEPEVELKPEVKPEAKLSEPADSKVKPEPAESAKAPSDDKPAAKRSARTRKQGPRK
ncbi:BMC domain-containing protein [Photobacterium chitinilyticum]|uniref:BMC domain-containing protein n=1 Tax=Photobacterium chitinilyticum TaxID=2485123 RepID=A0A444JLY4_9GAMM|nr:BMC domain-containing protein [Photobacterium chitinilyticum]